MKKLKKFQNISEINIDFFLSYAKDEWTLSQGVFLVFGKFYGVSDIYDKSHLLENSFAPDAVEIDYLLREGFDVRGAVREAHLYLKAITAIETGILKGEYRAEENDYRVKRIDFLRWVLGEQILNKEEIYYLIDLDAICVKEEIKQAEEKFLKAASIVDWIPSIEETISHLKNQPHLRPLISLISVDNKTLRNHYLAKKARKLGRRPKN